MSQIAFPGPAAPTGILFTDLDGTLLDFHTYSPSPEAVVELREIRRRNILVVPVSSKTVSEIQPLMKILPLEGPAVAEGGGVILAADGKESVTGSSRGDLVMILHRLQSDGWPLRGMSEMSEQELGELTGLDEIAADRAMTRTASEPFIFTGPLDSTQTEELERAAVVAGADMVRGGRFWHLHGPGINKGAGVRFVLEKIDSLALPPTAAIGDAWNDLPMLDEVVLGFILGSAVQSEDLPEGVIRIAASGPSGFAEAVRRIKCSWFPSS